MNNLRMVVAGTYTPTCVSVNVAPELGSGSEWQQRTYSDADAPVVEVTDASTEFWDGYDSAIRGAELGEMQTEAAKEGWWKARKHQGETEDYEDWLEDMEWFARGQW